MELPRLEVPARLRGLVAGVHGYCVPPIPGGVHHGLPSHHLTLVLSLAAPLVVDGFGPRLCAHAVVGGLHTTPALLDAALPQDGLQLALTPAGARALLGVPARDLAGRVVDLGDVAGRRGTELVERLVAVDGWPARLAVLEDWLRPGAAPAVPAEVAHAWRVLLRSRGRVRVERLAAEVGWSRRHLAERFVAATGLAPKQVARVVRFENARRHLARPEVPLSEVAVRCGYADQAHLAREWRVMAGCTPGEWRRGELPFVQDGAQAPAAQ